MSEYVGSLDLNGQKIIRFAGVADVARVFRYTEQFQKPPLLSGRDKSIIVNYLWVGWQYIGSKLANRGLRKWSVAIHDNLKIITLPLSEQNSDYLIMITTPRTMDHKPIVEWIEHNRSFVFDSNS